MHFSGQHSSFNDLRSQILHVHIYIYHYTSLLPIKFFPAKLSYITTKIAHTLNLLVNTPILGIILHHWQSLTEILADGVQVFRVQMQTREQSLVASAETALHRVTSAQNREEKRDRRARWVKMRSNRSWRKING